MQLSLFFPKITKIKPFLTKESRRPYSYQEVGASRLTESEGYDNDHNFCDIGTGEAIWKEAKAILNAWQHFPSPWTKIYPEDTPKVGQTVAVLFRVWGIWVTNSARIVYVIDEPNRYGFAYGTLPGHVEKGEECFWIERDKTGSISYHIKAFSKPRFWLARLGYPIARMYQRRFVKQSMKKFASLATALKRSKK